MRNDEQIVVLDVIDENNQIKQSINVKFSELQRVVRESVAREAKNVLIESKGKSVMLPTEHLIKVLGISGETIFGTLEVPRKLRKYLVDLREHEKYTPLEKISFRDEEIAQIYTFLISNQKSNAILVGEHGVGKTKMALEIIRQLDCYEGPKGFYGSKVLALDVSKLLECKTDIMLKFITNQIIDFCKENKDKVILYIDNLIYMKYDVYLARLLINLIKINNIRLMAAVGVEDYEEYFEDDDTLVKYLNPIYLEEPDIQDVFPIIKKETSKLEKKYGVTISEKMMRFAIFTGYHLATSYSVNPGCSIDVINFALADAKREEKTTVDKRNILRYYPIDFKLEKKTDSREKEITAYHEVGHYIVGEMSPNITSVKNAFVSILPIDGALGLTASYDDMGKQLTVGREYFVDMIAFDLGGRACERMFTNEDSSGAMVDLQYANAIAERCIMSYGLSNKDGEENKTYGSISTGFVLLTEEVRRSINDQVKEIINEASARADKIIDKNLPLIKKIVARLLEEGILSGDELDEIIKEHNENK